MKILTSVPLVALLLATVFILSCCSKLFRMEDDHLSMLRRDYNGDQLRIDGYYYSIGYKGEIIDGYWFYRNGLLISVGGITYSFSEMDDLMVTFINNGYYRENKLNWGVFKVEGDHIAFEKWYPQRPKKAYVRAGKILNETTFHITESYRLVDGVKTNVKERDEIYYFREFNVKPDSTNQFIK